MYKIFSLLAVLVWMGVIFFLSSQPAVESSALSGNITEYIVKVVEMVYPEGDFHINNNMIREYAHFFAYFVLGILVTIILKVIGMRGIRGIGLALLLSCLYAVFDEIHQIFSPGRGIQFKDVLVDSIGASAGIILVWVIGWKRGQGSRVPFKDLGQ